MLRLEEAKPDLDPFDFSEFPWPSGSDDLFDTSGSWTGHALLDWQRDTVTGRQEGFRRQRRSWSTMYSSIAATWTS
jgi:hypothetical protein